MSEKSFVDESAFFEKISELIKNEKEFKFYVKDESEDEPECFESSYKHEAGHTFLFTEFDGNWSRIMLWEDKNGNPIIWDDIEKHLLRFIADYTLHKRFYYLDESSIK